MAQGTTSRGDGGSAPDARAPAPVRLAARHEVPEHLRFNRFILHGYRSPQLTPMECLKSSAYLHNETVNVLTHLAPLVVTVVLLCSTDYAGRGVHYETARMVTSAGALSMFASVMYHLLMPATASEEQVERRMPQPCWWHGLESGVPVTFPLTCPAAPASPAVPTLADV